MKYLLPFLVAILVFAFPLMAFSSFSWKVFYDGQEVTTLASPQVRQGKILLNVTSLGPTMGVVITMDKEGVEIIDSQGGIYQANWGDFTLEGKEKILLSFPLELEKGDLFFEAEVVAKLAHKFLEFQEKERILNFTQAYREEEKKIDVFVEEGLTTFTIKKTPKEIKETKKRLGEFISKEEKLEEKIDHRFVEHDKMRLDTTLGFYADKEKKWRADITGSGKIYGGDVGLSTYLLENDPYLKSGFFSWKNERERKGFEIGRFPSRIYGMGEGVRYLWKRDGKFPQKDWSSLNLYFPDIVIKDDLVLSYSDEISFSPNIQLQGEVSSERSYMGRLKYQSSKLNISLFESWLEAQSRLRYGTSLRYKFGRRYSLGWGKERENDNTYERWTAKIPFLRGENLFLERRENKYAKEKKARISSLMTFFSLSKALRGMLRYEDITEEKFREEKWTDYSYHRCIASLNWILNKLKFNYQLISTYDEDMDTCTRLRTDYRISPKINFWLVTGFPEMFKKEDLNLVGFEYELHPDWHLQVQYWRFNENNFSIKLRKSFSFDVPSRGGTIYGRVKDILGNPIPKIKIKVANYRVITNEKGEYEFKDIPAKDYEVSIVKESIPARYEVETISKPVSLKWGTKKEIDFKLIPLSSLTGRVYEDKNKNGKYDQGEEIPGAVLWVNGKVTASNSEGLYGFYNLSPGSYRVYLDLERLPSGYQVEGKTAEYVEMLSYKPVTGVNFTLKVKEKKIIFQEIP